MVRGRAEFRDYREAVIIEEAGKYRVPRPHPRSPRLCAPGVFQGPSPEAAAERIYLFLCCRPPSPCGDMNRFSEMPLWTGIITILRLARPFSPCPVSRHKQRAYGRAYRRLLQESDLCIRCKETNPTPQFLRCPLCRALASTSVKRTRTPSPPGACKSCRNPVDREGYKTCDRCIKRETERNRKRWKRRVRDGYCTRCGDRNPECMDFKTCRICRKKAREREAAHR